MNAKTLVLPDAGPLITLAYADALDVLLLTQWEICVCDMVVHEVTRTKTPTSERLTQWIRSHGLHVYETQTYSNYKERMTAGALRLRNQGELAAQELMLKLAREEPDTRKVFLFEDHKIARTGFVLPENCVKVTTRAFLRYLEERGLIPSSAHIIRQAYLAGRSFSALDKDEGL